MRISNNSTDRNRLEVVETLTKKCLLTVVNHYFSLELIINQTNLRFFLRATVYFCIFPIEEIIFIYFTLSICLVIKGTVIKETVVMVMVQMILNK